MFCPKCGIEIPDDSVFCPKCGAKLKKPKASASTDQQCEPSDAKESGQPSEGTEPIEKNESMAGAKPKVKKKVIAIVAACLVVVVAVGVGVWWHFAHTEHLITVQVDAPGLDEGSTPIPVEISGTNAGGGSVHEWRFIRSGAKDVLMAPGSYDFIFRAGYVTSDAHVAVPSETTLHIDVEPFNDEQRWLDKTVSYKILDDDEVSDEQFALIVECAEQNPDDGGKAAQLCAKTKKHGDFTREAKANAEGFLMSVFDTKNNVEKGRSVSQFVTKGKYVQSGSYQTKAASLKLTMESDNKISYSLSYTSIGPSGSSPYVEAKGYVGIAPDGKVDSWYAEGSTRNSLYG